jgi:hypothetical protein
MKWLSIYIALPLIVGASQPYLRPIRRRRFTARLGNCKNAFARATVPLDPLHCAGSVAMRRAFWLKSYGLSGLALQSPKAGVSGGKPYRTHWDLSASSGERAIGCVPSCDVTQPPRGRAATTTSSHFIFAPNSGSTHRSMMPDIR